MVEASIAFTRESLQWIAFRHLREKKLRGSLQTKKPLVNFAVKIVQLELDFIDEFVQTAIEDGFDVGVGEHFLQSGEISGKLVAIAEQGEQLPVAAAYGVEH